jgi:hypothetical protein
VTLNHQRLVHSTLVGGRSTARFLVWSGVKARQTAANIGQSSRRRKRLTTGTDVSDEFPRDFEATGELQK